MARLHRFAARSIVAALSTGLSAAVFASCNVSSGPKTAALVELYTSEGCSSCPPADRQLSRMRESLDPGAEAVPLALHVGYWDYIGWKDPYAQPAFDARHRWLVGTNRGATAYTPQFFASGADLGPRQSGLRVRVRRLNALPAAAAIRVQGTPSANGALALSAEASVAGGAGSAALYVAVTESGLVSKVTNGENSGATLAHDHVVRAWIGPLQLRGGAVRIRRELPLSREWNRAKLDLVAFVQDQRTGSVLQALSAQRCTVP